MRRVKRRRKENGRGMSGKKRGDTKRKGDNGDG